MSQFIEEKLSDETQDISRVISSLVEELEAIDWYNQRMDATDDETVYNLVKHNRDEEMEHAAMALEWIRRKMPEFDKELRDNLFQEGEIGHH